MENKSKLTVSIFSFSYKKGIPEDDSENGGGFVFDGRGILNPGRIQEYKTQTGRDLEVKNYLETQTQMPQFLESVFKVVEISLDDYLARNFENLQISFGCTGGQHRSVYCADALANHIQKKYPNITIQLCRREPEAKNWIN